MALGYGGAFNAFARNKIGFALTGSHCCLEAVIPQLRNLINEGADIFPIISQAIDTTDTRYGSSDY